MSAKRVCVLKPGQVILEDFDMPVPQPGEVLIRTRMTLISPGTERAFFLALPNTNAAYPLYPGYSNIGEVMALGEGVTALQVGDRVACGATHASHVVFPVVRCVPVPVGLPDEAAVFFNLIAIAMQGVRKLRIELGEAAVVIGAGMIGLFALQLAKLSGAIPLMCVDQDVGRLPLAEQVGADAGLLNDANLHANIQHMTGRDGAQVVIEATGASAATVLAFQIAAARGRVSLLGSARGETDGVNFYRDVHRKGLTIIGAHEITRPAHESAAGWWTQYDEHAVALRLLAANRLNAAPFITHRFDWDDFPRAYEHLARWDQTALGMVVNWDAG